MIYSLIEPKIKPIVSSFTKMWLIFIGVSIIVMICLNFFTIIKTKMLKSDIDSMKSSRVYLNNQVHKLDQDIQVAEKKVEIATEANAMNEYVGKDLKNIFDLVPNQITLTKMVMGKKSLVLYGSTPSKDMYNALARPLRSTYMTSDAVFYLNKAGWYRFVSTNKKQIVGFDE